MTAWAWSSTTTKRRGHNQGCAVGYGYAGVDRSCEVGVKGAKTKVTNK
jgi:hypothetical protein